MKFLDGKWEPVTYIEQHKNTIERLRAERRAADIRYDVEVNRCEEEIRRAERFIQETKDAS